MYLLVETLINADMEYFMMIYEELASASCGEVI